MNSNNTVLILFFIFLFKSIPSSAVVYFESKDLGFRRCASIPENLEACEELEPNATGPRDWFLKDLENTTSPLMNFKSLLDRFSFNVRIQNATMSQVKQFTLINEDLELDIELADLTDNHSVSCVTNKAALKVSTNILINAGAQFQYNNSVIQGAMHSHFQLIDSPFQSGYLTCRSKDNRSSIQTLKIFVQPSELNGQSPFVPSNTNEYDFAVHGWFSSTEAITKTRTGYVVPCRTNQRLPSPPNLNWKKHFLANDTLISPEEMKSFRWEPTVGFEFNSSNKMWESGFFSCGYRLNGTDYSQTYAPAASKLGPSSFVLETNGTNIGCKEVPSNVTLNPSQDGFKATIDRQRAYFHCDSDIECDLHRQMGLVEGNYKGYATTAASSFSNLPPCGIFTCTAVQEYAHFKVRGERSYRNYFIGLDSIVYFLPSAYPNSSVIQINLADEMLYDNQLYHEINCTIVPFVTSTLIYLILKQKDGEETVHYKAWDRVSSSSARSDIQFNVPLHKNTTQAVCLSYTNEGEAKSVERTITIRDATKPLDLQPTESLRIFTVGKGKLTLSCPLIGAPPLTYRWIFDYKNIELVQGVNTRTLTFLEIPEEMYGTYTCIACNSYGNSSFEFQVQAQEFFIGTSFWVAFGIVFLVLLLGGLVDIVRKCKYFNRPGSP